MVRHLIPTVLGAVVLAAPLTAQRRTLALDASAGAKSGAERGAVSGWYPIVQRAGHWSLGLGVRLSAYTGAPIGYTNRGTIQGNLAASLTIDPAVYALNGAVFGEVNLARSVAVGANLDIVGISTGPARTIGSLTATPEAGSYFRYGAADHGALNSEFFLSVKVAGAVRLRGGLSHYVTNYVVTSPGTAGAGTARYQRFQTVPFVAVRLRL